MRRAGNPHYRAVIATSVLKAAPDGREQKNAADDGQDARHACKPGSGLGRTVHNEHDCRNYRENAQ